LSSNSSKSVDSNIASEYFVIQSCFAKRRRDEDECANHASHEMGCRFCDASASLLAVLSNLASFSRHQFDRCGFVVREMTDSRWLGIGISRELFVLDVISP
jgi:hypothetical protein